MNQFNCLANVVKTYDKREITAKRTGEQRSVLELRIAVDRPGKDSGADFFTMTTFGATADLLDRIAYPGQRLAVSGRMELQEWKDDNDEQQQRYRVVADRVDIIDWPKRDTDSATEQKDLQAA